MPEAPAASNVSASAPAPAAAKARNTHAGRGAPKAQDARKAADPTPARDLPETPKRPKKRDRRKAPGGPTAPTPFYARSPQLQRERASFVRLVNRFGTHLICARKSCRRERTCRDTDPRTLPRCFWQHRGAIRMIGLAAIAQLGIKEDGPRDECEDRPPLAPMTIDEPTVLGFLRDRGRPIHLLEKPVDAPDDPWCHEYDPDSMAMFNRIAGRSPA